MTKGKIKVAFGRYWRKRGVCRIALEVHEGKKLLEIPRHRRENNIKNAVKGVELESTNWIRLCQDMEQCLAVMNAVKDFKDFKNYKVVQI
jgi:hypothetical protein